jgi:hypothetical protein
MTDPRGLDRRMDMERQAEMERTTGTSTPWGWIAAAARGAGHKPRESKRHGRPATGGRGPQPENLVSPGKHRGSLSAFAHGAGHEFAQVRWFAPAQVAPKSRSRGAST